MIITVVQPFDCHESVVYRNKKKEENCCPAIKNRLLILTETSGKGLIADIQERSFLIIKAPPLLPVRVRAVARSGYKEVDWNTIWESPVVPGHREGVTMEERNE